MDFEQHNEQPEKFRKQLAAATRNIGWSYAIFWVISSTQHGVLKWADGYYNGDIKTRKTVQEVELYADELGMQRSEQLRELFESLSLGECSGSQARRPLAALSPEDLTESEWYYLICMSFEFAIGQGLPGRAFAENQPIWLCNVHRADKKVFNRSLLAESAAIQTVVCFPFSGGVIELGVTELVDEDLSLIQRVKASFLELPCPNIPNISNSDKQCQFMDEEIFHPMSSSDHESQTLLNRERISDFTEGEIENYNSPFPNSQEQNMEDELSLMGIKDNDIHYHNVLSTILRSCHRVFPVPKYQNTVKVSSFVSWKSGGFVGTETPRVGTPQRLLKKVLFEVTQMHCYRFLGSENGQEDGTMRPQAVEIDSDHVLAERRRRKNINDKFTVLGSLIPATNKVDRLSILDNTIDYVRGLEKRVEELISSKEARPELQTRREKLASSKRKVGEMVEEEREANVVVNVNEDEVLVEIRCQWKDSLLLQIMDMVSRLQLDSYSIQSVNANGVLSMTIKSKFRGDEAAPAAKITKALERVVASL